MNRPSRMERRIFLIAFGLGTVTSVFALAISSRLNSPWSLAVSVSAVSFLLAFLVTRMTAARMADRIQQILQTVRGASRGDFTARVRIPSRDEVAELGDAVNEMVEELDSRISRLSDEGARLRAILGTMVEGVMILDGRGNILMINAALEEMFRLNEGEAIGRPSAEVLRHSPLIEFIKHVLEEKRNLSQELVLRIPQERWFEVQASVPRIEEAKKDFAVLVFHDMTEIKRLERVRKDFVANVSHEIRTPLTSIKGYVEALLDGAKDDPERSLEFLNILRKHTDQLNNIVADLLSLAQIESGQAVWNRDDVRMAELAEKVVSMIRPMAEKKRQQLITSIPNDLPIFIGDSEKLIQVLVNLVENAVKYTPEGGTIRIEGGLARGQIEVSVVDNGMGIPPKDLSRIFERFYRVDRARSREMGGTGLGLSIVKHIVESHGGSVRVESQTGKGSRFTVVLPIRSS